MRAWHLFQADQDTRNAVFRLPIHPAPCPQPKGLQLQVQDQLQALCKVQRHCVAFCNKYLTTQSSAASCEFEKKVGLLLEAGMKTPTVATIQPMRTRSSSI